MSWILNAFVPAEVFVLVIFFKGGFLFWGCFVLFDDEMRSLLFITKENELKVAILVRLGYLPVLCTSVHAHNRWVLAVVCILVSS